MPYISPEQRRELDGAIDELAARLVAEAKKSGFEGAFAGLLNYACTRLALKVVRTQFGQMRYWLIATLTGTFKNMADEFYRRVGAAYENQQMTRSGDVDLYQEYLAEIAETG